MIDTQPQATILDGPWLFSLAPEVIAADAVTFSRDVSQTTVRDGVEVTVDRVMERSSGIDVYFTVVHEESHKLLPVDSYVHLTFADGSETSRVPMVPVDTESLDATARDASQFVATFPSVSRESIPPGTVKLAVGTLLRDASDSVEVLVDDPFGPPSAMTVEYEGETFSVETSVARDGLGVAVSITNIEPIENATRMFIGVNAEVVAIDSLGRVYRPESIGTGLRRDDKGNVGAGDSILIINGLDPQTTSLTLVVSESSHLVYGPWEIEFSLN